MKNILGYDCTVVEEVSEYNLDFEEKVSIDDVRNRVDAKEQLIKIKDNLENINDELDTLVSDANLMVNETFPQEKITDISNLTSDLEKTCTKLKSIIEEDVQQ